MSERELIVKWLRHKGEEWWERVEVYRKAGNNGPYLGEPNGHDFARGIERGDHLMINNTDE